MSDLIQKHIQNIFGCSSANFDKYPELWMANIEMYIPQIFEIISMNSKYKCNILNMLDFDNGDYSLKNLFDKYGSDKGDAYFPLYTHLLQKYKQNNNLRLLEIGLGTNDPNLISTMGNYGLYRCGGSLRAFRDFLPNASIYGADIDRNCLFNETNINTFFVDQLNISTFDDLNSNCGNSKFDIIIDDGLHCIGANLNTLIFALKNINKNGIIIIEDIPMFKIKGYQIVDFILKENYKTSFITYKNNSGFIYLVEVL
jgi:hypothetical protein